MLESRKYFDPRNLAKLKGLRLRARHVVEGFVAGLHRSPHRGFSIEFAEHREYVPGDDLRYLDWKVFGRTDKFYLKQFEDETNLICYLVLDVSESMSYRGPDAALSKLEYAQCLVAALTWLVLRQQDAVGLVTFDAQLRRSVAPSGSAMQLDNVLQVLEEAAPEKSPLGKETRVGPILHDLAQRFRQRGVVVIFSDLLDDTDNILAGLKHLRHRRHDVIVFHILDRAEIDLPFDEPTRFRGMENLPDVVTDPPALQRAYRAEVMQFLKQTEQACRGLALDYQLLTTEQPLDLALFRYLATRKQRVR